MSPEELIKKADLALSDLSSNGGILQPEQANRFIRTVIDQPTILRECRTVTMNSPTRKINKIGFGSRILRAASQTGGAEDNGTNGRRLAKADRVKPDLGQVELTTSEVIAEIHLPYEVLEDNLEKADLQTTILDLIAERAALDIEELVILGDTASGDSFLALMDGILVLADQNNVNAVNMGITKDVFNSLIKALPTRYRRNKNLMWFYTSMDIEQDYRSAVAARGTALGDDVLTGTRALPVFGVPLKGVAQMPDSKAIFTDPQNVIVGFQRNIRIESEKDIRAREYIIVLTARLACAIEETRAMSKATNVNVTT